jgi:hypothetical protein
VVLNNMSNYSNRVRGGKLKDCGYYKDCEVMRLIRVGWSPEDAIRRVESPYSHSDDSLKVEVSGQVLELKYD